MIIGIAGNKFAGKDTVADYITSHFNFKKLYFSHPLKIMCKSLFNLSDNQLHGSDKEIIDPYWNKSPRELMQIVGTNLFRNNFNKNIWILSLKQHIKPTNNYVISDVRFLNEAKMIQQLNGTIIKIYRSPNIDSHESESEINLIKENYILNNTSSLETLYKNINTIINKINIKLA